MNAIVRIEHQRSSIGKKSSFKVRGRPVDRKDVVKYWKRKGLSLQDVLQRSISPENDPEDLEILTPPASPVLLQIPMLTEIELVLRSTSNYVQSCRAGYKFARNEIHSQFTLRWQTALDHLSCGDIPTGGFFLRSVASTIEHVIASQKPCLLAEVCILIISLDNYGFPGFSQMILEQISALSALKLGRHNPISYALRPMVAAPSNVAQRTDLMTRICRVCADIIDPLMAKFWWKGRSRMFQDSFTSNSQGSSRVIPLSILAKAMNASAMRHDYKLFLRQLLCKSLIDERAFGECRKEALKQLNLLNDVIATSKFLSATEYHAYRGEALYYTARAEAGLGNLQTAIELAQQAMKHFDDLQHQIGDSLVATTDLLRF